MRFPGVAATTSYGTPSVKVGKRLLARLRTDPDAIVLKVTDLEEKEALLAARPAVFFTTEEAPRRARRPRVSAGLRRAAGTPS